MRTSVGPSRVIRRRTVQAIILDRRRLIDRQEAVMLAAPGR
jgi:hypothetical protein